MTMKRAAGFLIFRNTDNNMIQYLLLKASYGDNHWTPPKGHVDPGENEWLTALRETKEESGLDESDLEVYKDINKTLEYQVNGQDKTVIYWLAKLKDGNKNVILSDEHTEYRWLNLEDTKKLAIYSDFNNMLQEFHNKISNTH